MENRIVNNHLEFDYLSPNQIQFIQRSLLAKLYLHARNHPVTSSRIKMRCSDSEVSEKNIKEVWNEIPIIESETHQIHARSNEMDIRALSAANNATIVFSTSGSRGNPKYVWLAYDEMMRNTRYHGKGYSMAGINHSDRVATFGLPGYLTSDFTVYHGLAATGCQIVPVGSVSDPATVVMIIRDLDVNVLLAMPSNLLPIVNYLKSEGERLEGIRLIVTGGEKLHDTTKEFVRTYIGGRDLAFGSTYQTADAGTIGFQCSNCADGEYHMHEELQYVELVNIDGASHVVVTNLDRYLMPVMRVLTGDIGQWLDGDCLCGRKTRRLKLLGRVHSDVKIGGEKVQLSVFEEWVNAFPFPMENTGITIDKNDLGQDLVSLKVACDFMPLDAALIQEVADWLLQKSSKLKAQVTAGIVSPIVVDTLKSADLRYTVSGKKMLVNDRRLSPPVLI